MAAAAAGSLAGQRVAIFGGSSGMVWAGALPLQCCAQARLLSSSGATKPSSPQPRCGWVATRALLVDASDEGSVLDYVPTGAASSEPRSLHRRPVCGWRCARGAAWLASAACFFLPLLAVQSSSLGLIAVGKIAYTAVLIVVTLEVLLVSHHITALYVAVALLSCALWLPLLYLIPQFSFVNELTGMAQELLPEPLFWLVLALCAVCFFVYRISTSAFRAVVAPTDATILREREKLGSVRPAEAAAAP